MKENSLSFTTYHLPLKMLLTIDIGNTNVSLGVYEGEHLIAHWRLATVRERSGDETGVLVRQMFALAEIDYRKISRVIVASVVPELNFAFRKMSKNYLARDAIFVDNTFDFGLKINYNPPSSIGIDRIVAAFAAVRKYGKPCIVCDLGTATTIDAVNSKGEYLGGIIAPGINLLAEALFRKTSKLPRVEIRKPERVVGNSTTHSIQSGIYFGFAGLVDGIIRRMIEEVGENPQVVATGGHAALIAESCKLLETVDETLLLEGLRLIDEKLK